LSIHSVSSACSDREHLTKERADSSSALGKIVAGTERKD
jgi:hypothetical protein